MNVLIIHRYFWPESISTLPIMFKDIVHFHLNKGDNVSVVCGAQSNFEDDYLKEFGPELHVDTFQAEVDRDLTILGRIKNVLKLLSKSKKHVAANPDVDIVYLVSYPPLLAGLLSKYIRSKNSGAKIVYIVQDILNYRIPTALGKSTYNFFHKWTLKQATLVTTLSESMQTELLSLFKKQERDEIKKRIWIIPNYSTDVIDVDQDVPDKITDIIYAGNHGHAQNLYHFIDAVALIDLSNRPSIAFFGNGTEQKKLIAYAKEKSVDIDFNDPVGRKEAQERMSESRFGLVGAMPGLMRYAFPSKLAAYNAAGTRAILMAENSNAISDWIKDAGFGNVIDPTDVTLASQQLVSILSEAENDYNAGDLREKAASFYSKSNYINRLSEMLQA